MILKKIQQAGVRLMIIIAVLAAFPLVLSGSENTLDEYMAQKALCNYGRAIEIIEEWSAQSRDPRLLEINVFRIYELIKYPDLYEKGLSALRSFSSNSAVAENPFLRARVDSIIGSLCLKLGRIDEAVKIRDALGFAGSYRIVGPFRNGGQHEFDIPYPPENGYIRGAEYTGKVYKAGWFNAACDLSGAIDIKDLFQDVDDTIFYFETGFNILKEGNYILSLGKTGFADIWLDGKKIFSNRNRHSYFTDQYFIRLSLSPGAHRVLLKAGDSPGAGLKVSMRITDEAGNPVETERDAPYSGARAGGLLGYSCFKFADSAVMDASSGGYSSFIAGYLLYISGLNSVENRESSAFFSGAGSEGPLSWVANYYLGILEREDEKRDFYLYKSLKINGKNIEALKELSEIKIKNNFLYEAAPLIESVKEINPLAPEYFMLKADLMLAKGWHDEAVKIAGILKTSQYPAEGSALEAKIHRLNKRYREAADGYMRLYKSSRYSLETADRLIECLEFTGEYREIENILESAVLLFPNSVWVRLKLAEHKSIHYNPGASLPYLSSAKRLSPFNRQVLFDTGMIYHKLGKKGLAAAFLQSALNWDPNNFELKRYLRLITGEENEIDEYMIKRGAADLAEEAAPYSSEPAVVLLNETAFRILADGSYEKSVHRIVKINDQNAARDYSSQYVVINPASDRVEDFRCAVFNNGERLESSDISKRPLSDPESRLYYDLEAYIITLPSVREQSIVETRYTVRSRGGAVYKNYFGEKITIGEQYRTVISNSVISFPEGKRIYCHLKDIKKDDIKIIDRGSKKIYRILKRNIPPYRAETAMPHYAEILPCVYFTSFKDWDDLYGWYISLVRDRIKISGEMRQNLKKVIGSSRTGLEKTERIYNHVNDIIRYVGFEFGVGGIQPRSSDLTYHTRMGDCKDITLVLIALLREAGIDAKMALLRVRDSGEANLAVPFLGEFNHAVCYVDMGRGFFIDGTAKMSGFRELPDQDSGITALVLDEKGYSFINTESEIYLENFEAADTAAVLRADGSAELSRTITRQGSFAASARHISLDREKWLQRIREFWNRISPGSAITGLKIISMEKDRPVSYNYNITVPSFLNTERDEAIMPAFISPSNYYKNYTMFKKRAFPLELSQRWSSGVKIRYVLPPGFSVFRIPENERYDHEKFSAVFNFIYNKGEGYIEVESAVRFKDYRVSVSEYEKFRGFARFIDRKENEKIILIKNSK